MKFATFAAASGKVVIRVDRFDETLGIQSLSGRLRSRQEDKGSQVHDRADSYTHGRPPSLRSPTDLVPTRLQALNPLHPHWITRPQVTLVLHNPSELFPPYRGYAHAAEVVGGSRLLFISGLNGFEQDGTTMPENFDGQAELIWKHIKAILASADMGLGNLVSLRTYLADPKYDEANGRIRAEQLGSHRVASTVVCCQLLETRWKLEVEAVAAA